MVNEQWILGSNSPRRRELLALFGHPFLVIPADVDESLNPGEAPANYVARLAQDKAAEIEKSYPQAALILAADTTVADGDEILGKPLDSADAERMLRQLRGRVHQVYTAITIIFPVVKIKKDLICCTQVPMRNYSDQELEEYIYSGDPLDKAGAYAIQNLKFHPVENFSGCFASVMGLPLCHFSYGIRNSHPNLIKNIANACQKHLQYQCSIYERVLKGEEVG